MDNNSKEAQIMVPAREINVITGEIIELRKQANNMLLVYAIEVGRRLVEAKAILPHGEWGNWLKDKVDFSQSTANNLMKLYDEYGQSQLSLFGAVSNSQTIGNLPYSKALQLIAIPEKERESFAKEVDAEHISVKELKAAIEERNAAIQRAETAEKKAAEKEEIQKALEDAKSEAETATEEAEELKQKIAELEKQLADEKTTREETVDKPTLSSEELEKIKSDAVKQAKEDAAKEIEKKLNKAKTDAEKAESKRKEAEARAEELENRLAETEKQLKTANPEISAFKTLFEETQRTAQSLKRKLIDINKESPEVALKLLGALKALGKNLQEVELG
ncbi:MAG: DUF3102 domain-containing protein [Clostridia bacterium]|nr:DUF3102 domain-containing protein [Clostridia bacterium]